MDSRIPRLLVDMVRLVDFRENLAVCASFGTIAFLSSIIPLVPLLETLNTSTPQWACLVLGPTLSALIAIRAYFDKTRAFPEGIAYDRKYGFLMSGAVVYGMSACSVPIGIFPCTTDPSWTVEFLASVLAAVIAILAYHTNPRGTETAAAQTEADVGAAEDRARLLMRGVYDARADSRFISTLYIQFSNVVNVVYGPGLNGDIARSIVLIACILYNLRSMYCFY